MKSRTLAFTAVTLFVALAIPLRLAAQDNRVPNRRHHHYKLIDMGTFGGPVSSIVPFLQGGTLNSRGVTLGWSATSTPTTPTSSFLLCGGQDSVVQGSVPQLLSRM